MGNMELLHRQHKEIGEVIRNLEELMRSKDIKDKSFEISMNIAQLAGKLSIHLNSEDKYLYPSLMQHADPKVQQVSQKFVNEMGDLLNTFTNYKSIYMLSQNVKKNPMQFLDESRVILSNIKKRVSSEEKDLYPLLQ